jgi:hypothetical protein
MEKECKNLKFGVYLNRPRRSHSWKLFATVPKSKEAEATTDYAKETLHWSCCWAKIKRAIQYKANGQSTKVGNGLRKRCLSL